MATSQLSAHGFIYYKDSSLAGGYASPQEEHLIVLGSSHLEIYDAGPGGARLGLLELVGASIAPVGVAALQVTVQEGHIAHIACADEPERDEWIFELNLSSLHAVSGAIQAVTHSTPESRGSSPSRLVYARMWAEDAPTHEPYSAAAITNQKRTPPRTTGSPAAPHQSYAKMWADDDKPKQHEEAQQVHVEAPRPPTPLPQPTQLPPPQSCGDRVAPTPATERQVVHSPRLSVSTGHHLRFHEQRKRSGATQSASPSGTAAPRPPFNWEVSQTLHANARRATLPHLHPM